MSETRIEARAQRLINESFRDPEHDDNCVSCAVAEIRGLLAQHRSDPVFLDAVTMLLARAKSGVGRL